MEMAKTQEAGATISLEEKVIGPAIKMEEEEHPAGEEKEAFFLPQTSMKQEPGEGPSGNWDAQLREFVMMLQAHHSGGEILHPPEFRPPADAKTAQGPFQQATETTKAPREEWLSEIQPHLLGEDQKDQKALLEATPGATRQEGARTGDAARVELRRRCFRTLSYQDARGPRELCGRLLDLCRQWLKPERHSKEQILELVTLEQFLAALPLDMQIWVTKRGPESCAQAVTLAEEFLLGGTKGCGRQITGVYEEESATDPSHANQDSPGTETMQVLVVTKQGGGASVAVLGDGWLREKEKNDPLPQSPEKREHLPMFWGTSKENNLVFPGDPSEHEPMAKRQMEDNQSRGDVCSVADRVGGPDGQQGDKSGASEGENPHLPLDKGGHAEERPYTCWHCGLTFASSSDLLSHERDHVGEKLYKCSHCGESERVYVGQKPHNCSRCGNTFSGVSKEEVCGMKIHVCMVCLEEYTEIAGLLQHRCIHRVHRKMHRGHRQMRGKEEEDDAWSQGAEKTPQPATGLRKTRERDDPSEGEAEGSKPGAKRPRETDEGRGEALFGVCEGAQRDEKNRPPEESGERLGEKAPLSFDEGSQTEEKPCRCWHCGQLFASSSDLRSHERNHGGEKLDKCSRCGGSEKSPTGQRAHKCSPCGNASRDVALEEIYEIKDVDDEYMTCGETGPETPGFLRPDSVHNEEPYQYATYIENHRTYLTPRVPQMHLAGNGWLREQEEEKPSPPSPEETEQRPTILGTVEGNDCRLAGEDDENNQRETRQTEEDARRGEDVYVVGGGASGSAVQRDENLRSERSREGAGKNAPLASEESGPAQEKLYTCWHCGQIFTSCSDLLSHERNHVGEKLYKCSQCGESERIHVGPKPHKCSHCGSTLSFSAKKQTGRSKYLAYV